MSFYDRTFSFGEFIDTHPDLQAQLVDALVGNVFKDLRPLFDALDSFSKAKTLDQTGAVTT
jgi:hypothetical protein